MKIRTLTYIVVLGVLWLGTPQGYAQQFNSSAIRPLYTITSAKGYTTASPLGSAVPLDVMVGSSATLPSYSSMGAWQGEINQIGAERPAGAISAESLVTPPVRRGLPDDPPQPGAPLDDAPYGLLLLLLAGYVFVKRRRIESYELRYIPS